MHSKWVVCQAVRAGLAVGRSLSDRYVTEEQRSRWRIFIATSGRRAFLFGCKDGSGYSPSRFAHPGKIRSSATTPVPDLVHSHVAAPVALLSFGAQTIDQQIVLHRFDL
jgi:hypothetical protein